MGMVWGVQHKKLGEEKGRICRGNPCFSGFFSYNAHDSDAPEGGENERIGGGFAWGCAQKKEPRNGEFLSPFGVIIGVLTCSRFERREHISSTKFILSIV